MNPPLISALAALAWLAILAGGWLGWQLLRQNGRMLFRLEELEKRVDQLEFGEGEAPAGLAVGSEAPAFELPDLAGERKSLAQFRGRPLLLIFFNPECRFCREMVPRLAAFSEGSTGHWPVPPGDSPGGTAVARSSSTDSVPQSSRAPVPFGESPNGAGESPALPSLIIITTGDAEKNRQFFAEHRIACPVLLQNDGEIAKAYQVNGTPAGYLVSADGKVASELAIGAEALLALAAGKSEVRSLKSQVDATGAGDEDRRAGRFGNRSLARSKIKRDGLKAGTSAPDFRLPRLDDRGDLSLEEFRGRRVLLVFSSPHCGPCDTLAPELEKFHRQQRATEHPQTLSTDLERRSPIRRDSMLDRQRAGSETGAPFSSATHELVRENLSPNDGERESANDVAVVMITKGEPKENRAKVKEHGLTFPVVLQQHWEISRRYAMFATPIAYLINKQGVIAAEVAVGVEPILALLLNANSQAQQRELAIPLNQVIRGLASEPKEASVSTGDNRGN